MSLFGVILILLVNEAYGFEIVTSGHASFYFLCLAGMLAGTAVSNF